MSKQVKQVVIQKKFTVEFKDGERRQNLNVGTVADILTGSTQKTVKVVVKGTDNGQGLKLNELVGLTKALGATDISPEKTGTLYEVQLKETTGEAEKKPGLPHFILDKAHVFTTAAEAFKGAESLVEGIPLSEKYQNSITKTFVRGDIHGQVKSLYRDWKLYGAAIMPKIKDFFAKIASGEINAALYKTYLEQGKYPDDSATFTTAGKVDTTYFKLWVLGGVASKAK